MRSRNRLWTVVQLPLPCLTANPVVFAQISVSTVDPSAADPSTVDLNATVSGSGFPRGLADRSDFHA